MKKFSQVSLVLMAIMVSAPAFAGPNSSGGVPETEFQHSRDAIRTILDAPNVIELMEEKGRVLGITPDSTHRDVYSIVTEKCELRVRFIRDCDFSQGLPQCVRSAEILQDRSMGSCLR